MDGYFNVGIFLLSRAVTSQVSSAPTSLTSVFGMGTGGSSLSSTPTVFAAVSLRLVYNITADRKMQALFSIFLNFFCHPQKSVFRGKKLYSTLSGRQWIPLPIPAKAHTVGHPSGRLQSKQAGSSPRACAQSPQQWYAIRQCSVANCPCRPTAVFQWGFRCPTNSFALFRLRLPEILSGTRMPYIGKENRRANSI